FRMVQLNLLLALFNMLPIPPLDGGNVLAGILPEALAASYDRLVRPYGFVILIVLMATGWLYRLIGPPLSFLMGWLLS
ncbi:MAG: site-2 protease family protein, partial [Vicinamibacterales bacterium]|nr:site-2 protease family protein [Vicinamibacterales bacterium]